MNAKDDIEKSKEFFYIIFTFQINMVMNAIIYNQSQEQEWLHHLFMNIWGTG